MKIIEMSIDEIKPYDKNPRHNDEAVEKVMASIREFDVQQPIVVDKDNVVIVGHTRLKAAKKLGMKTFPVVVADLPEEKAKAYRLADNKTGEFAEWDFDLLNEELDSILDLDMGEFGFDGLLEEEDELQDVEEDEVPEPPAEPKAKLGDLWQLGRWVYCKKCGKKHYIS